MNPYSNRLNRFNPYTIAQGVPIAGQKKGIDPKAVDPKAVDPKAGVPLQAIDPRAASPEQLKQEAEQMGPSPFGGPPLRSGPTPRYTTDIGISAEYQNQYGTKLFGNYVPNTGAIKGGATIPIGAAEKGLRIGIEGGYTPGQMDPQGMTPPSSFDAMLRFSKSNPVDPKIYKKPGEEKYSFNLGVKGTPRRIPPQMAIPIQLPNNNTGPTGPFQKLLNSQ